MRIARLAVALFLLPACASTLDRARTARDRGDIEDAQAYYERALEDSALEPVARQELATMLADDAGRLEESDPGRAESVYEEALRLDAVNGPALTGLVRMLRKAGRTDRAQEVINAAAAAGSCGACNRLAVVLLLDRADEELRQKNWDAAIGHYSKAQELRAQTRPALAIANAHMMAGRHEEAATALDDAAALMTNSDASLRAEFARLRRTIVTAAIEAGNLDLADRARRIHIAGEASEELVALARAIADGLMNDGKTDEALVRYEALLSEQSELSITDAQRTELLGRVVNVYANRGTAHLHAGEAEQADAALAQAIELDPEDWVLKLQRILAVSESTGAEPALAALDKVPEETVGLANTRAIVLSQRVLELMEAGELEQAKATLAKAQAASSDLPEVHLAAARVLSRTPIELDRRERSAVKGRTAMIHYPGEVYAYGEALGELDWVRGAMRKRNEQYLFTAPWLGSRADALHEEIAAVYPYAVAFRADPEPQLVLKNEGPGFLEVSVSAPDVDEELGIGAGEEREMTLPDSGIVTLKLGKRKQVFYAEPYTRVTLPLR